MKILIAAGIYPPESGGPATYAKLLADALPKRGFSVSVLPYREANGFPKLFRHIAYTWMLFRASSNVDIIFAQDPVSVGLPALIVARLRRKKFFLRVGGDYAWEQGVQRFGVKELLDDFVSSKKKYSFPVRVMQWIQLYVSRGAEKIIVPGEYLKTVVVRWGINPEKIFVVRNTFVSETEVREEKNELRALFGLSGNILITAGRLVPWKGVKTLIELMPQLQEKFPDIHLLIAGDGPERRELETLAGKKGGGRVKFLGNLPHNILFKYIKAADIFALNTGYEGFSHLLLETMHTGTPIVTTDAGGNPELIESGKEGILVSYNNKSELFSGIEALFENSTRSKEFVQAAREKVKQFIVERTVGGTISVLS